MAEYTAGQKWYSRSKSKDIPGTPWLHPDVIKFLDELLSPEMRVLEIGGGGSTLWLAERVKQVVTVESDPDWFAALQSRVPSNVQLVLQPAGAAGDSRKQLVKITKLPLLSAQDDYYDFILIDNEPLEERAAWINAAQLLIKKGGLIMVDNANRPLYAAEVKQLDQRSHWRKVFNCNEGETKYLVTAFFQLHPPEPGKGKATDKKPAAKKRGRPKKAVS